MKAVEPVFLRERVSYDPETGMLYWLPRPASWFKTERAYRAWQAKYEGKPAFNSDCGGYRAGQIKYGGRLVPLYAHRVAWVLTYGEWPNAEIDHINGVPDDNRLCNLRVATRSENLHNTAPKRGNKRKGGYASSSTHGRWCSRIRVRGKIVHLGQFSSKSDAEDAYEVAARIYFGEFGRSR